MWKVILSVLVAILLINWAKADLPVHCLVQNVTGRDWVLEYDFKDAGLEPMAVKKSCSQEAFWKPTSSLEVQLAMPNIVNLKGGKRIGNWTMVADQGIEVRLGSSIFFALFQYKQPGAHQVISYCDRTLTGTVVVGQKKWGCFRARRSHPRPGIHHRPISDMINWDDNISHTEDQDEDMFKNDIQYIKHINEVQGDWKATAYPHFETFTKKQLNTRMGQPVRAHHLKELVKYSPDFEPESQDDDVLSSNDEFFRPRRFRARQYKNVRAPPAPKGLPRSWDWRNATMDGGKTYQNFLSPVRDQKSCGSCYVLAFIDALEARVRVATKNKHKLDLSPQYSVSCSPYAQGCKGGFPFAVAKFVHDFGMVQDKCMPYEAQDGKCSARCSDPGLRVGLKSYGYIGNYYGNANEEQMMREIMNGGPIVTSIYVHDSFKYYKSGVYHAVAGLGGPQGLKGKWEMTSHSICIVGWGEENGKRFWVLKNSWGSEWGDEGFIKILRGVDESASESQPITFQPKLI